jgi:hypothetical protein
MLTLWGPWDPQISAASASRGSGGFRALAQIFAHRCPDLADTLAIAETGDERALGEAWNLLHRLPTVNRRRILSSYGNLARDTVVKDARLVEVCGADCARRVKATMTMTRQPTDRDIQPHGHLVRKGSALHPHRRHRTHPAAHDLDVMLAEHGPHRKGKTLVHQHGGVLHDPKHLGGDVKAPVRRQRKR